MTASAKHIRWIEPNEKWRSILSRLHRTVLALVGSYFLSNGFIALVSSGSPHLGMARAEAVYLGLLLGLCLFVVAAIWSAATRYLARTTSAIIVLSVAMHIVAPLMAPPGV